MDWCDDVVRKAMGSVVSDGVEVLSMVVKVNE